MNYRRLVGMILSSALTLTMMAGCTSSSQEGQADAPQTSEGGGAEPVEVALLLTGYANDAGFCETCVDGLKKAESELGVTTAYSEALAKPDFESTMRDYADQGFDLVICAGNEFSDAALAVAPSFADTKFAVINGNDALDPNVAAYRFNTPETGFLAGALAAMYSETGSVGFIGGSTSPHIKDGADAFVAGAQYVNPEINAQVGYTESWTDVAKGKEMGMAFIEQGADVVSANADACSLGVIDAAKTSDCIYIGYNTDQNENAPEHIPVSVIQSNEFLVYSIIQEVLDGNFAPALSLYGMNEGAVALSDFYDIGVSLTEEEQAKLEEIVAGIQDGSLKEAGILPKSSFEQ